MEHFATTIALVGIVIVVASLLSGAIERTGLPLVGVFLALGAALGPYGLGLVDFTLESPSLRVLATLGLALVLFSDAVTIETTEVRTHARLVWRILGPGTLLPAALIAAAAWLLLDFPPPAAAILGAALASTDPVLLRNLLRSRALPPAARVALRLESGMNDVVLLPIVVLAILVMQQGGVLTAGTVGRSLVGLFILGPGLGVLIGWLGIVSLVRVRERIGVRRDYESLYALGLAFSAYAGAEAIGASGFLAAFTAGLIVAMQDVELCDCFMEYGEASAEMLLLLTFVALGTTLIWTGLTVIDGPTLLFAVVALVARTVVLWPVLSGLGLTGTDCRIIALSGPRGLSSLLFALLAVFAGVAGAERLFTVTCLVVLLSVLLHGTGISLLMRAQSAKARRQSRPEPAREHERSTEAVEETAPSNAAREDVPERIELDEVRELMARGERVIAVDARADRSYRADDRQAEGAVRLPPDEAVETAQSLRLSQHATLVVYCA